ncbi:MAG: hypothetical protein SFU83_00500 [Meiothermus sp.]|nr:hypothetical protein [Meiothermus sp.]
MSRVVAAFERPQHLEEALHLLAGAGRLGREFQVLTAYDDLSFNARPAFMADGVNLEPCTRCVPHKLVEATLMREGLAFGDNRLITDLMHEGGVALIVGLVSGDWDYLELLRKAGAAHVVMLADAEAAPPIRPASAAVQQP